MKRTLFLVAVISSVASAGAEGIDRPVPQDSPVQQAAQIQRPAQRVTPKTPAPAQQPAVQQAVPANPEIDFEGHLELARKIAPIREERRLTEGDFIALAAEPGAIVLDARSADKFQLRHIKGAKSLPYTDFTAETLAKVIPAKNTPVLNYCNNNLDGDEDAAPVKRAAVALNFSTYASLAAYGYTNIYELAPYLNVKTAKVAFEGANVGK
jgi:phage shock protein E